MIIEDLKKILESEILILAEIDKLSSGNIDNPDDFVVSSSGLSNRHSRKPSNLTNKNVYNLTKSEKDRDYESESLLKKIRTLNDLIPEIINKIGLNIEDSELNSLEIAPLKKEIEVLVSERGRTDFLKSLNIDSQQLKRIKRTQRSKPKNLEKFDSGNWYNTLSNKIFFSFSQEFITEGKFKNLITDVRKSNINILSTTYLSIMFFSIMISLIIGLFVMFFAMFFTIDLLSISIQKYSGSYLTRLIRILWIPIIFPLITFSLFYFYPAAEKKSISQRINQEIPFVVIHMASISGSGIEPIDLFRIIAMSKEYEFAGKEFSKILNQTNFYGYDLSTALRNVSLSTPSTRFSELLNGMAITINSGGDMQKFFEKRAESLLLEYRLEREKANKSAETFMDLYISIVIATPMIMVMLLVIISISKISTGFNPTQMTTAIIGIVAIVNILFLSFLHMKQLNY